MVTGSEIFYIKRVYDGQFSFSAQLPFLNSGRLIFSSSEIGMEERLREKGQAGKWVPIFPFNIKYFWACYQGFILLVSYYVQDVLAGLDLNRTEYIDRNNETLECLNDSLNYLFFHQQIVSVLSGTVLHLNQ